MPVEPPDKRRASFLRMLAVAMELPFIPVAAVVIGGVLGYLVDERLGTSPWLTLVFGALGFLAGIREVLRRLKDTDSGE